MSSDDNTNCTKSKPPSWTPDLISCLLDVYGEKFCVGRGYLRNKDWEDVMNAVNSHPEGSSMFVRTMKQCRDKIDTLKRRYKVEKRKAVVEGGNSISWPHFKKMDEIMGSLFKPGHTAGSIRTPNSLPFHAHLDYSRLDVDGLSQLACGFDTNHRRSFSRSGTQDSADDSSEHKSSPQTPDESPKDSPERKKRKAESGNDSVQALANAIVGFSEVFARIEVAKMEIFSKMKFELAKLESKRRKRRTSSSSSASSSSATE